MYGSEFNYIQFTKVLFLIYTKNFFSVELFYLRDSLIRVLRIIFLSVGLFLSVGEKFINNYNVMRAKV